MTLCALMQLDFTDRVGRYDEGGQKRYDDGDLRFGIAYAEHYLEEGHVVEPMKGYDLRAFAVWCAEQLECAATSPVQRGGARTAMARTVNMTEQEFRTIVEGIVGPLEDLRCNTATGIAEFRAVGALSLRQVTALSKALGTDRINFNFGWEGTRGYSELTPGTEGAPGCVDVPWPIPKPTRRKARHA